jgi:hypothetical protein
MMLDFPIHLNKLTTMKYLLFFAVLFLSLSFSSCKKGCSDPKALNYNDSAKTDDGTCIYCTGEEKNNNELLYLYDFNAPINDKHVMNVVVNQKIENYIGNGCKSLDKENGETCSIEVTLINITNYKIGGAISVRFSRSFPLWNEFIEIPNRINPGETLTISTEVNSCVPLEDGTLETSVANFSLIYQQ